VTARIQAMCRPLGVRCLASQPLYETVGSTEGFAFRCLGEVELRGTSRPASLYAVERPTAS